MQSVEEGSSPLDISTLRVIISQLRCHGGCPPYVGLVENLLYAQWSACSADLLTNALDYGRNTLALGRPLCKISRLLFCFLKRPTKGQSVSAVYQGHQGEDRQSM